jgi:hypothetical protein
MIRVSSLSPLQSGEERRPARTLRPSPLKMCLPNYSRRLPAGNPKISLNLFAISFCDLCVLSRLNFFLSFFAPLHLNPGFLYCSITLHSAFATPHSAFGNFPRQVRHVRHGCWTTHLFCANLLPNWARPVSSPSERRQNDGPAVRSTAPMRPTALGPSDHRLNPLS